MALQSQIDPVCSAPCLWGFPLRKPSPTPLKIPLVGIHHLEGHVYSNFLAEPDLERSFPLLILIVSGGHTQIVKMTGHGDYEILGRTRDDAAGEAFDKGARLLNLPYPGGPNVSILAEGGNPKQVAFPRAMLGDSLDFSFSGVKTSIRSFMAKDGGATSLPDVAASFQAAIVDALVEKMRRATKATGIKTLCVAGGVAANRSLASEIETHGGTRGLPGRDPGAKPLHRQRRDDRTGGLLSIETRRQKRTRFRHLCDGDARTNRGERANTLTQGFCRSISPVR